MNFSGKVTVVLIAVGVGWAGLPSPAEAVFVQTVQTTTPSGTEPVWGQGLTINVGSIPPDSAIPPDVQLELVGFRMGDNSIGSPGRTAVYLHVYDDFTINPDGTIATVGGFVGASINTLNLETPAPSTDLIWNFSGPTLSKSVPYHYIMANSITPGTSSDTSNLIFSDLEVAFGDPHGGGQAYVQTGDEPLHDLYFRVLSSFDPVPEPSTFLLALGALLALGRIAWRKRHRTRNNER